MMITWVTYAIGFTAQLLFSARLLLQWIISEKNKKVVTPSSFWVHSLIASFLLFIYGDLRHDFSIMLGQTITYYIYIRNLQFRGQWHKLNILFRWFLVLFPLLIIVYYFNNNTYDLSRLLSKKNIETWLLILGIIAQMVFTTRFIVQWIYSEKIKESVLPLSFWWISLIGSGMILTYAIFRKDPVLFVGQIFGLVVYFRNIILTQKK
ncbi:MAG: lipid-A-disaccharide synthase N-terminal domain-containing protein [Ginsengibacter sp.]